MVARRRPHGDRREVRGESGRVSLSVKGLKSSSRVAGRGQCCVLKTSTATETMVHREGMRIAPHLLGPDRSDLLFGTKGARSRHADTEHIVDAEAQTVCLVSHRCSRRESVIRVFG